MISLLDLQNAAAQIGKWRYFLTGLSFAVLFGLVCRALGRLIAPLGVWRKFHGTCIAVTHAEGQHTLTVQFQDAKHLHHTAAFRTSHDSMASLQVGDAVPIAIRTDLFIAGGYAETADHVQENDGKICTCAEQRAWLLRTLMRIALQQLLICGIALAVFIFAMKVCFP